MPIFQGEASDMYVLCTAGTFSAALNEKAIKCMCHGTKNVHVCVNTLPRRLYSVPVPIMDGVMGILDSPHA